MAEPEKTLPSIEGKLEEVMGLICDRCHHLYTEPTPEEELTGCCSACESCLIEEKIKYLIALTKGHAAVEHAKMIAQAFWPDEKEGVT